MERKPRIFIGSSIEGLNIARNIQLELEYDAELTLWNQGVFVPGLSYLELLARQAETFDFAILIALAEDKIETRGNQFLGPRDNILFELGLFIGSLGRERTFLLCNRDDRPKLPSDVAGVVDLTFANRDDGNLRASLGPACQEIRNQIVRLGLREQKRLELLTNATKEVESVGDKIYEMLSLLTRSRKDEIELISQQFGALIQPKFLEKLKQDIVSFEKTVKK